MLLVVGVLSAFSVWAQFIVRTGKKVTTREECHWSHACKSFKRSKGVAPNGILERKFLSRKRAPYSSRNPMMLTLTQQNPWWKTRTVQLDKIPIVPCNCFGVVR